MALPANLERYAARASRNKTLGALRIRAHEAFDPLWQSGKLSRTAAYNWLALKMGLPMHRCHIKLFNERQCHQVIALCTFENLDEV